MPWQMLLPYVVVVWSTTEVDVITSITSKWQMLLPFLCHVADGKPHRLHASTFERWQMLLPSGRWILFRLTFSSGLRKLCLKTGESLSLNLKICSVLEKILSYIISNKMRNIHSHLRREYGKENVKIFWQWEKIENKMADFSNLRRFSLRCLSEDIIPVSIRLKSNIKTPKGYYLIKKGGRALLNERIRSINNTINMLKLKEIHVKIT